MGPGIQRGSLQMSATTQLPDGSGLEPPQRQPPPLLFSGPAARASRPLGPRVSNDRPPRASKDRSPRSQAAAGRRTSWLRRLLVLVVLAVGVLGVVTAIRDSRITIASQQHGRAPRASTLLSAEQLGLAPRHRDGTHHRPAAAR